MQTRTEGYIHRMLSAKTIMISCDPIVLKIWSLQPLHTMDCIRHSKCDQLSLLRLLIRKFSPTFQHRGPRRRVFTREYQDTVARLLLVV
jgi:hypothetical protein